MLGDMTCPGLRAKAMPCHFEWGCMFLGWNPGLGSRYPGNLTNYKLLGRELEIHVGGKQGHAGVKNLLLSGGDPYSAHAPHS